METVILMVIGLIGIGLVIWQGRDFSRVEGGGGRGER